MFQYPSLNYAALYFIRLGSGNSAAEHFFQICLSPCRLHLCCNCQEIKVTVLTTACRQSSVSKSYASQGNVLHNLILY